jgi:6-phosphogluconate dehydrogenase
LSKCDIGIIGLGIMGRNIALNFGRNGSSVAVYNPDVAAEEDLLAGFLRDHGCDGLTGARLIEDFLSLLREPRIVLLMVKAGSPVDDLIHRLVPGLAAGDIIIDGGNSHYLDTARRLAELENQGILYVGCGVSGGGSGALRGPSLMPGGSSMAWETVGTLLKRIAAKLDDGAPCCEWIGPGGSGHFVKTVHNGIEYAMMESIAEAYDIMNRMIGMDADETASVFNGWNAGELGGFLMGIVPRILKHKDGSGRLIDSVLDRAWQKGTGKDAVAAAIALDVPVPAIDEAVAARFISSLTDERRRASALFPAGDRFTGDRNAFLRQMEDALYCSLAVSYAQGFALIEKASSEYTWGLDRMTIARIWGGGCIIQSKMMKDVEAVFSNRPDALNMLLEPPFSGLIRGKQSGWRRAISTAVLHGVPVPVMSSALAYFDSYRSERLPANLTQAMRDCFGAHGYERVDAPAGKIFRTDWSN